MESKPVLAILSQSIRFDSQNPLKYFKKINPKHFYESAPYGDLKQEELRDAIQYRDFRDLEQKIIDLKPDIIQGAEPYGSRKQLKLCFIAWKLSRKLKIPLIFPVLENRPVLKRFGILGVFMRMIMYFYAKQASLIFYLNEGAKRNLLEAGVESKKLVKLLYGIWGIDTDIFKPMTQIEKKPLILFMGRLDEAKGLPYVVEAWKSIEKDFPQISIHFSGKGELENLIQGFRMSHGFVKNSDLPELINSALFTITASVTLPKWEEQVGMTNLQAMACAVPVITTLSGGIPEYVTDEDGILVRERSSEDLTKAMRALLVDKKLRENLGVNARRHILQKFDSRETIEKTEDILVGLLK